MEGSGTLCGVTSLNQANSAKNSCSVVASNAVGKLQVRESRTELHVGSVAFLASVDVNNLKQLC